jgi:hypothetical protein
VGQTVSPEVIAGHEPWYYGYLDGYAWILKWIAILVFVSMALIVTGIAVFWCVTTVTATRDLGGNARTTAVVFSCLGAVLLWVVAILQLVLGFALSLVGVAYIHLAVDAARNIRALKLKHG